MENGYEILWTSYALQELAETYEYLETYFSEKELQKLSKEIASVLRLISQNPELFPDHKAKETRRVVILKYNTLYYRKRKNYIEILSFFSNRQNPDKNKLL